MQRLLKRQVCRQRRRHQLYKLHSRQLRVYNRAEHLPALCCGHIPELAREAVVQPMVSLRGQAGGMLLSGRCRSLQVSNAHLLKCSPKPARRQHAHDLSTLACTPPPPSIGCSPASSYARMPGATLCVRCVAGVALCVAGTDTGCNSGLADAPSAGKLLCLLKDALYGVLSHARVSSTLPITTTAALQGIRFSLSPHPARFPRRPARCLLR